MIDFRYHIVSLISVFLALAVGIALGAGPLKESIGDTLTGQVEQLRTEKDEMRAELDLRTAELAYASASVDALGPAVLEGVLGERRVAVIEVADVVPEVLEQVTERIGQAGGSVSATVQVGEAWTDPTQQSFRQQIAGTLLEYLEPVPADDAGTDVELAEALVQALTRAQVGEPDVLDESSDLVLEILKEAELVLVEGDVTRPADAVVLLAGPTVSLVEVQQAEEAQQGASPEAVAEEAERTEAMVAAALEISLAAQARSVGAVVATGAMAEPSLVQALRADADTSDLLSTVDGVQDVTGQVAVPLALAARIAGTVGHYGPGAEDVMPQRVVLPTIERVVDLPDTDTDGAENDDTENEGAEAGGADGQTGEDGAEG